MVRLTIVAASIPHAQHDQPETSAVDVVLHELVRELRRQGHAIVLQPIFNVHRTDPRLSDVERADVVALEREGIVVLAALAVRGLRPRSGTVERIGRAVSTMLGRPQLVHAYPAVQLRPVARERLGRHPTDAVVTIWSPEGVAAFSWPGHPPILAYQGDVDHEPGEARLRDRALFGLPAASGLWARLRERVWLREFRLAHGRLMREVAVIANVTAANATYYTRTGHTRSIYVRNVWHASPTALHPARAGAVRIVGHAGRLDATGSTFGLRYLLAEVLPELERAFAGRDLRVEIIGGGTPAPGIAPLLLTPRVFVRGFVQDLDAELRTADAYLLLNNVGPYVAAYTRHLVAWSVGACLVVHERSRLAIPEIVPGTNALTGSSAREIAEQVRALIDDPTLRERIAAEGQRTFERSFTPSAVATALDRELQALVGRASGSARTAASKAQ